MAWRTTASGSGTTFSGPSKRRTTAVGSLLGLVVAMLGARLLAPLLFEVGPADPVTVAWVSAAIFLVSILATYVPPRRATSVDPRLVLQEE